MNDLISRRCFLGQSAVAILGVSSMSKSGENIRGDEREPLFRISLAEWSLHRTLFAGTANNDFGVKAVEYVNQFFKDKASDQKYLGEMKKRTSDLGVRNVLIMIDDEGALGDPDEARRKKAVENHYKWVEAAKFLGCHSIRVNAQGEGSYEDQ